VQAVLRRLLDGHEKAVAVEGIKLRRPTCSWQSSQPATVCFRAAL
jgi:hypothetical protein